jgi:hypothetical protein
MKYLFMEDRMRYWWPIIFKVPSRIEFVIYIGWQKW